MKKKHIITIGGRPGSGKSTASRSLASTLGYEHFSSGDLFRAIGKERGIDVHQTNVAAYSDKQIDELVDQRLRDIGKTQDNVVIDSRLAWHWIPQSFKVYLDLDLLTAAQRIINNAGPTRHEFEQIPNDAHEYAKALQARLDSETERYKQIYKVNPHDHAQYDLVIDTTHTQTEQIQEKILLAYNEWLSLDH